MRTGCDFRKGFVGGERGFSAASSRRCCDAASTGIEGTDEGDDGEGDRTKVRNPKASRAARMKVIGLVRRATAIMACSNQWEV